MAKQTENREDLLRDGTAMPVRGRFTLDGREVVIGFRTGGQFSVYWDQDPVFQFDDQHRLRRAYIASVRFKAQEGHLVRLHSPTVPTDQASERLRFNSSRPSKDDERQILQLASDCLQQIKLIVDDAHHCVTRHGLQCVGAHPEAFCRRVADWISQLHHPLTIAESASA